MVRDGPASQPCGTYAGKQQLWLVLALGLGIAVLCCQVHQKLELLVSGGGAVAASVAGVVSFGIYN